MKYFIADLHLGHPKIAETRGFSSVEAHDAEVMRSITSKIGYGDTLWILGDISSGTGRLEREAIAKIDALDIDVLVHLVAGNHDSCHPMHRNAHIRQPIFLETFDSVQAFARTRLADLAPHSVLLSHFPYVGDHTDEDRHTQYRLRDEGKWIIHGHTHSKQVYDAAVHPRQICVSWDAVLEPVSELQLARMIRRAEQEEAERNREHAEQEATVANAVLSDQNRAIAELRAELTKPRVSQLACPHNVPNFGPPCPICDK